MEENSCKLLRRQFNQFNNKDTVAEIKQAPVWCLHGGQADVLTSSCQLRVDQRPNGKMHFEMQTRFESLNSWRNIELFVLYNAVEVSREVSQTKESVQLEPAQLRCSFLFTASVRRFPSLTSCGRKHLTLRFRELLFIWAVLTLYAEPGPVPLSPINPQEWVHSSARIDVMLWWWVWFQSNCSDVHWPWMIMSILHLEHLSQWAGHEAPGVIMISYSFIKARLC